MSQENKVIVRKFFELLERDQAIPEELLGSGFAYHASSSPPLDLEATRERMATFSTGFSDIEHIIEDMVAEGDRVAFRSRLEMIHTGVYMGVDGSNEKISVVEMGIMRIANGKVAEMWGVLDSAGIMQQLGLMPVQGSPKSSDSLHLTFSKLDRTFSQGQVNEVAKQFAEDARMLWPGIDDIVGREAIRAAFAEFFEQFTTLSFSHDRQLIEVFREKAFTIGRSIEDLAPKGGGPAQRIHGRMVELWAQTESGDWEITLLLTSRYAENEMLSEDQASA